MQLFNYRYPDSPNRSGVGIEHQGERLDFSRAFAAWQKIEGEGNSRPLTSMDDMIERELFSLSKITPVVDFLTRLDKQALAALKLKGDWKWATPVLRPGKIVALVQNYRKHAEEFGNTPPDKIVFFGKFPSTMIPHMAEIVFPAWLNSRVDHEVELAVVIGKTCSGVSEDRALDYVAGYTIMNDVSARHVQKELREKTMPWMPSKNIDSFCPIGPYLVPRHAIENPQHLHLRCKVNGSIKQDGTTEDMISPISKIISSISKGLRLEPGDIIATGTPEGVSKLVIGDNVVCEIDGLGSLQNHVTS